MNGYLVDRFQPDAASGKVSYCAYFADNCGASPKYPLVLNKSSSTNEISQTYYFRSTGLNSLSFYAVNSPDPSANGLSPLDSPSTTTSVNVIPFALTPDPTDYSIVNASVPLSLSYSSQTAAKITTIDLSVNGYLVDREVADDS